MSFETKDELRTANTPRDRRRITIIVGSERQFGNSDRVAGLLATLFSIFSIDSRLFFLHSMDIKPCGRCGSCNDRTESCELNDDAQKVVQSMTVSDAIIYVSPVHGFGLSHLMQIFLERAGVCFLRFKRPLENKLGGIVVIGRRYSHGAVFDQLVNNILLNRMIIVGSGYPVCLQGGGPGRVFFDQEGMSSLWSMVVRISCFLRMLGPNLESLHRRLPDNERMASIPVRTEMDSLHRTV